MSTQRSVVNVLMSNIAACYLLVATCILLSVAAASYYLAEKRQHHELSALQAYTAHLTTLENLTKDDLGSLIEQYLTDKQAYFSGGLFKRDGDSSVYSWGTTKGQPVQFNQGGYQLTIRVPTITLVGAHTLLDFGIVVSALILQLLLLLVLFKLLIQRHVRKSVNNVVRDLSFIDCKKPEPIQLNATLSQFVEYRQLMASVNRLILSLISSREQLAAVNDDLEKRIECKTASLVEKNQTLVELNQKLSKLANTDALTQVYNRTRFDQLFAEQLQLCKRRNERLSVLLIDLDDFKLVNDEHGHQIGDHVLMHAAQCIRDVVGDEGLVARWGGEEFAVLLPYYDLARAESKAEDVRSTLAASSFEKEAIKVTTSIGVAELDHEDSCSNLLKRADDALYNAKGGGRNRVILAYASTPGQLEIEALGDGEFIEVFDAEPEPSRCE